MKYTVEETLSKIDQMEIYEKDVRIIKNILDYNDPQLTSIIVEGILDGDISWSDFDTILNRTEYNMIIDDILENQEKIKREAKAIIETKRKNINSVLENSFPENVGLLKDDKNKEFYEKEFKIIKDNLLYELTRIKSTDNELTKLCKLRMSILLENESVLKDDYEFSSDDIFFFINDYVIPVDSRFQNLNITDRMFMKENNMTEDEMKKFKSVQYFLRKNSNGGNNA